MVDSPPFADRADAGRALAARLEKGWVGARMPIVFGVPRGGIPVAFEVAQRIGAELQALVVTKIRAPSQPEYALGAVGPGGMIAVPEDVNIGGARFSEWVEVARQEQRRREAAYHEGLPPPSLAGRDVVIVDDGIATGWTVRAAVKVLRAMGCGRVALAAPVAPPDTVAALAAECDLLEVPVVADPFPGVSEFYCHFGDVSDETVVRLIRLAAKHRGPSDGV